MGQVFLTGTGPSDTPSTRSSPCNSRLLPPMPAGMVRGARGWGTAAGGSKEEPQEQEHPALAVSGFRWFWAFGDGHEGWWELVADHK